MLKQHRDSQKRIYFEDAVYFITFYPKFRFPYFQETIFCDLFVEELRLCKLLKGFYLYAWVLLYDHVHLLIRPNDKYNISDVIHFLKRHSSRNINIVAGNINDKSEPYSESADGYPRFRNRELNDDVTIHLSLRFRNRELNDDVTIHLSLRFRDDSANCDVAIQQFDKLILDLKTQFNKNHSNQTPYPKFLWQKSFHDHYIRNDGDFDYYMDYMIWNPDKHGMADNWQYIFTNPKYYQLNNQS